jgi:DNA-binding CsgD family transcriptional regulator
MPGISATASGDDLQNKIDSCIKELDAAANHLPCTVVVHNVRTFCVEYMSQRGLDKLETTMEELRALGPDYHHRFFNPVDSAEYVPKIMGLLQRKIPGEEVAYFQQVRKRPGADYHWYLSTTKVLMCDDEGQPLLSVTCAFAIDSMHRLTAQAARLLAENNFLRANWSKLQTLGRREKEVLSRMARGEASRAIAEALHLSPTTVDTHRRNIKRKLGIRSTEELQQFARVADLI